MLILGGVDLSDPRQATCMVDTTMYVCLVLVLAD